VAAIAMAGVLWLSLTAYALFGGADFGGGVWDILARGPRAEEQRQAIAHAMGPVWEANHVWLIFLIVGMFTAFPVAYGALATALFLPFTVALVGIVLRGAAFGFRTYGREAVGPLGLWGVVFGGSSIIAPAMLAAGAAAVAMGTVRADTGPAPFAGWTSPFAVSLALLAVSICAYLAATYLMVETEDRPLLQADFRRRAVLAAVASGVFALVALPLARVDAPELWAGLTGRALPLLVLAVLNGPLALVAVWRHRPRTARAAVTAQIVLVLWAWAVAQWPKLVPPDFTIAGSAAPTSALTAELVIVVAGMLLLLPSLYLLLRVFKAGGPSSA
jgi:cytochrome d ubiquinol oxidase subunit II